MSGGQSSSVPLFNHDHYVTAQLDYSVDFRLYYQRNAFTPNGITVENQSEGMVTVTASAMDAESKRIRFLVRANQVGVAEVIVRATTVSGPDYPVKFVLNVRSL